MEIDVRTTRMSERTTGSSDEEGSFIQVMPVKRKRETVTNDVDRDQEDDDNNGAILVHSIANGKPNLAKFMEQLEEAMERCEDPVYM